MNIGYYAFSLFLTGLICLVAIVFKVLFSNVKGQQKILDEKESNLLQLYRTVESIMEEFNDQVKAATSEIREFEDRAALITALPKQADEKQRGVVKQADNSATPKQAEVFPPQRQADDSLPLFTQNENRHNSPQEKSDPKRIQVIPAKSDNGSVFQKFLDDTMMQIFPEPPEIPNKQTRNEAVLALAEEGKTEAQIASELGIMQNEVKLIIGLTGKRA